MASVLNAGGQFGQRRDTGFTVREALGVGVGAPSPMTAGASRATIAANPTRSAGAIAGGAPHVPILAPGAIELSAAEVRADEACAWRVEAITNYGAFLGLEPIWNRLVEQAGAGHPFVRHEWVRAWWENFGAGRALQILLVTADHEPVAIVPLMLCAGRFCGLPVRQLQFIWNVYAERFDFIIGRCAQAVYGAVIDYLRQRKDWDVLLLPQLPSGSATLSELPRLAGSAGMLGALQRACDSPYLPVFGSWQSYWDSLDRKHRSNLRNREKRLNQCGTVSLEVVSTNEPLAQALEDGFCLEGAAWKQQAGTSIASCAHTRRFYTRLAELAAERGWLRLCFLKLGEQRIAFAYYLEFADKLFLLKPGYDPAFASYSPSSLLCNLVLRDAYRRGIVEVDFLANSDEWKLRWTRHLRPHYRLYLFPDRIEGRLLYWIRFRLMSTLAEDRMLRLMRDIARDLMHGRWRMLGATLGAARRAAPSRGTQQENWSPDAPVQPGEV